MRILHWDTKLIIDDSQVGIYETKFCCGGIKIYR